MSLWSWKHLATDLMVILPGALFYSVTHRFVCACSLIWSCQDTNTFTVMCYNSYYCNLPIICPPTKINPPLILETSYCVGSFIAQRYTLPITSNWGMTPKEVLQKRLDSQTALLLQHHFQCMGEFHQCCMPLYNELCTDYNLHLQWVGLFKSQKYATSLFEQPLKFITP